MFVKRTILAILLNRSINVTMLLDRRTCLSLLLDRSTRLASLLDRSTRLATLLERSNILAMLLDIRVECGNLIKEYNTNTNEIYMLTINCITFDNT